MGWFKSKAEKENIRASKIQRQIDAIVNQRQKLIDEYQTLVSKTGFFADRRREQLRKETLVLGGQIEDLKKKF